MTPERMAELRRLAEGRPLEFVAWRRPGCYEAFTVGERLDEGHGIVTFDCREHAELFAAARTAIPELLARVEELERECNELHASVKRVVDIGLDEAKLPTRFMIGADAPERCMREILAGRDRLRAALVEACEIGRQHSEACGHVGNRESSLARLAELERGAK